MHSNNNCYILLSTLLLLLSSSLFDIYLLKHTLCKPCALCQGGGSEQDKTPTLMHSQCWGASHVNGYRAGSDMSPERDSDGVLWGAVGGRDEDQPGGPRRASLVWGGSTHPGPWKMGRNYSCGVSRVRVCTVSALEEHSFMWEYVETLKVQRLTQGPAAANIPGKKRRTERKWAATLSIMGFLRREMQQGLELQGTFLTWRGAVTGRVWILPEEEQHEPKFRGRNGQNTLREGSADLSGGYQVQCMLGGDVGQFDYREPRSLSSSVGLWSSRKILADEFDFILKIFMGS